MNRMNNKTLLIIMAVLLAVNIGLLYLHFRPQKTRNPTDFMVRELSLDKEQTAGFEKLLDTIKAKNKPLYDSMRANKDRLFGYLKMPAVPDSIVKASIAKINYFDSQILFNNYQHFGKLRRICRPDQQVRLDSIVLKMGRRRR